MTGRLSMDAADPRRIPTRSGERYGILEAASGMSLARIAFYGTLLAIAIATVPNGTVEVWQKALIASLLACLAFVRIADALSHGSFKIAEPFLLAPMAAVIVFAGIQLAPLAATGSAISVDPYETRIFIFVFGSLIVCAEILFTFTNSISRLKALTIAVLAVAFGSALFGALWELLDASGQNFLAFYVRPHQGYAQFINRNHFAVMAEMAAGLLIGLLLRGEFSEEIRFFGWVATGFLVYSLVAASSRGGLVSLAGMAVFAVFLHVFTKRSEPTEEGRRRRSLFGRFGIPPVFRKLIAATVMGTLVTGFVILTIAFVGGDQLVSRFEKVDTEVAVQKTTLTNRNIIWASTLDLIAERPFLGAGFGAYKTAITRFDRTNGNATLAQAHNDYLEILANGGIAGAILFAAFAGLVLYRFAGNLGRKVGRERAAYTFGALVGIFGVMVHNLVDFGLHVMVNALVFVTLIVIGAARIGTKRTAS